MHVQNRLTIAHRTTDRVALRHDSSSPPPDRKKAPLLQLAVEVYREHVSAEYNATRGGHCGYHESCSCYACKTLQERGVGALPSVMSRLRRCTSENDLYRLSQLLRFTAQCPQDRVSQFFHAQDAQTRQAFLHFRAEVSKGAVQLASGNDPSGVGIIESALQAFTRTTHFAIDEPMGGATEPRGFHLIPRRPARPTFMADRGPLGNGLRTLGSLAVAVPSCVIGGAVGAVLGMGVGASEGLAAGLGLNRALEAHANSVGGVGSLNGTTRVRAFLQALHHRSHAILGFECLADLIGGPVGVVVGLAGGGLGGLSTGVTVSWKMGRILGRSLSDGALKERFPSRGRIEVAPARIAPSLPSSTLSAPSSTAQQAQKMWNVLTDTPEVFRTAQRPGSAPTWRFALFSDATSADLESAEIRRVIEFERNLPQRASARIHLRRGGLVPSSMQRLTPWAQLAASAAALAAVGGVSGPGLIPVLLTRLTSLGVSLGAVKELVRDRLTEKEGHWTGQRVYALSQPTGGRSDHIESTPLEHHPAVLPSARTRLVHDLTSAFQQEGPRVAIFSGHGRSY